MKPLLFLVIAITLSPFGVQANAAYTLTPLSGGQQTLTVLPGDSFVLDLVLESDQSDEHTAVELDVVFSHSGLLLDRFIWGEPYQTGGTDDRSDPANSPFAQLINQALVGAIDSPIDVHFENFTKTPFTTGNLVSVYLTVPGHFSPSTVSVDVLVLGLENDNGIVATATESSFLLRIPEPSSLIMLVSGLAFLQRQRKYNRRTADIVTIDV